MKAVEVDVRRGEKKVRMWSRLDLQITCEVVFFSFCNHRVSPALSGIDLIVLSSDQKPFTTQIVLTFVFCSFLCSFSLSL